MVHVFAPAFVGNAEDEHDVLLRVGGAPTLSGFAPDECFAPPFASPFAPPFEEEGTMMWQQPLDGSPWMTSPRRAAPNWGYRHCSGNSCKLDIRPLGKYRLDGTYG